MKSKLKNDLKPTVIANWKLWVPAQFINFRLVPPHLQACSALQQCVKHHKCHYCMFRHSVNRHNQCQWGSAFTQCNLSNVREQFHACKGLHALHDSIHLLVHGLPACMWLFEVLTYVANACRLPSRMSLQLVGTRTCHGPAIIRRPPAHLLSLCDPIP